MYYVVLITFKASLFAKNPIVLRSTRNCHAKSKGGNFKEAEQGNVDFWANQCKRKSLWNDNFKGRGKAESELNSRCSKSFKYSGSRISL